MPTSWAMTTIISDEESEYSTQLAVLRSGPGRRRNGATTRSTPAGARAPRSPGTRQRRHRSGGRTTSPVPRRGCPAAPAGTYAVTGRANPVARAATATACATWSAAATRLSRRSRGPGGWGGQRAGTASRTSCGRFDIECHFANTLAHEGSTPLTTTPSVRPAPMPARRVGRRAWSGGGGDLRRPARAGTKEALDGGTRQATSRSRARQGHRSAHRAAGPRCDRPGLCGVRPGGAGLREQVRRAG